MENNNRESKSRWGLVVGLAAVVAVIALMLGVSAMGDAAEGGARGETLQDVDAADGDARTAENCALEQTYRFSPCGHTVTRRVKLPASLVGVDFEGIQHYYHQWRVDTFAPYSVVMSRDESIYCPMHQVLMADETGTLGVFQNVYGDGMAFIEALEYTMEDFDESMQEMLFTGIGFDSREEIDGWILEHRADKS